MVVEPPPDGRLSDREYLSSLELVGIKLGLAQIRGLLDRLDHPEAAYPSLTVAGTNGKGSVTAMVERGLRAAGYRTGRYTSPHLVHIEERFAVDGVPISARQFDDAAAVVRAAAETLPSPPSFFEATTALALDVFARRGVDVAVLEVGLGGRLDATNAVDAIAVAITAIDFDHEAYLGHTLAAIAAEKAGVIKPGALVVVGANPPEARDVIADRCRQAGARCVNAEDDVTIRVELEEGRAVMSLETPRARYANVRLALRGRHQVENAVTAVRLLEELAVTGSFRIDPRAIRLALEAVEWPARLELLAWRGHPVLVDGAHNPAGARRLASYLSETYGRPVPIVVAVMRDKQVERLLAELAPVVSRFFCTAPSTARAVPPDELAARARQAAPGVDAEACGSPIDALARACACGSPVVVAGSLYLAGEMRAVLP